MLRQHPLDLAVAKNADDMRRVLPGAELLIANNRVYNEEIGRVVLALGQDLRWIQYSTAGIERGIRFGMPHGIPVCAASGIKGPTVAEHAMLLLLASFRRMRDIERARDKREWIRDHMHNTARTLEDATLVVVGFGAIGQQIARKAKAFDMRVIVVSRAGRPGPTVDEAVPRERLHEVLPRADAVVLCLPVEPDTIRLFGDAEFACMKRDAMHHQRRPRRTRRRGRAYPRAQGEPHRRRRARRHHGRAVAGVEPAVDARQRADIAALRRLRQGRLGTLQRDLRGKPAPLPRRRAAHRPRRLGSNARGRVGVAKTPTPAPSRRGASTAGP